ncbi:unnamed protein product [Ranitomeya imitator]|uniref:non-specific serine/threonine protein kinase n=1 Tax=Ranitomeya imitator TaxID=111125 RepID=A0ABN9MB56_9NEOB|nr:unnamed protein product [Ranitomeya imitator]
MRQNPRKGHERNCVVTGRTLPTLWSLPWTVDAEPSVKDKLEVLALLQGILTTYAPDIVLPLPDGVLSFTYRMVMKLAEERSQSGDLAFFKQLAQKFLDVLEFMAPSLKHLETPDGDSKEGQQRNIADPNTSEPRLKSDLIEETTEPATADGGISETPEIPESASVSIREDICISSDNGAVIRSLNPMRKPSKSDYTQIKEISSGSYGVFIREKREKNHEKSATCAHSPNIESLFLIYTLIMCNLHRKKPLPVSYLLSALGGDCSSLIKLYGHLPLDLARMYIAETVLAVEYLHSYGVVHRDLKPENLMISLTGHIKVTDFGLSKLGLMRPTSDIYKARTKHIIREFCADQTIGTLSYVAPEVILQVGYGRLLTDDITLKFQNFALHPDAENIMSQLLRKNPRRRLGTGGANEIKSHPFLSKLDFENLQNQKPQFRPNPESEEDTHYFHTGNRRLKHMDSDKGDTSEVIDWPESLNYVSSSQRLSKLYATNTRMMSNEDHEPSPDSSLETSTKYSDVQKESPTTNNGDSEYLTAENNKSPSPILSVEKKNTSALKLGEEQDPEIVAETEPSSVEMNNTSALKLGVEQNSEIVAETEPSRVETKNTSALKLGEEQDPEIVAETETSRVETNNTTALKLGEDQDPDIVAETEPSRIEKKTKSAIKLAGEKNAKIVEEREPRRHAAYAASIVKDRMFKNNKKNGYTYLQTADILSGVRSYRWCVCVGPSMTSRSRERSHERSRDQSQDGDVIAGPSHRASIGMEAAACTDERREDSGAIR